MEKAKKAKKEFQSPTNEMEIEKLENSSNEETEEEPEDGQQDREKADSMMAEMDEPKAEQGEGSKPVKTYTKQELRKFNELRQLSPRKMAAKIEGLEKELYELSQREAREITRSKYLDCVGKNKRRFSK